MELVKAVMFVKQIHAMHSFFTLARNNAFFMCIDRTCSNLNGLSINLFNFLNSSCKIYIKQVSFSHKIRVY